MNAEDVLNMVIEMAQKGREIEFRQYYERDTLVTVDGEEYVIRRGDLDGRENLGRFLKQIRYRASRANPVRIVRHECTCFACPTQYDMWTEHGEYIYVRYRYGTLWIEKGEEILYQEGHGDGLDGVMDFEEIEKALNSIGYII